MAEKTDDAVTGEVEQAQGPVRGKLLTEEESHDWGMNVQIEEPKAKTEQNALRQEFEDASSGGTEEKSKDDKDTQEETETEVIPEEPEVQYVEDPGEFIPNDYSFEVTTYNEDGSKPKSVKVTSIEQWEELLDSEPNLGSSLAVNKAFRNAQKMELGLETDKRDWEAKKTEYDDAVKTQELHEQQNTQVFNEMSYLMDRGDLPKLTQEEMNNLNWADKKVLEDHPNIRPHSELLAFMRKENNTRVKAGLAPLNSALDAYNAMQLQSNRRQTTDDRRAVGEARRAAGARVSSATSTPVSASAPRGIAVGRVGNLSQLGQNWQV